MYYTYVLISLSGEKTYTGHTSNLRNRLQAHNNGEVLSSKKYRPYKMLIAQKFTTLKEAKTRELYYKNFRGRQKIKQKLEGCI